MKSHNCRRQFSDKLHTKLLSYLFPKLRKGFRKKLLQPFHRTNFLNFSLRDYIFQLSCFVQLVTAKFSDTNCGIFKREKFSRD